MTLRTSWKQMKRAYGRNIRKHLSFNTCTITSKMLTSCYSFIRVTLGPAYHPKAHKNFWILDQVKNDTIRAVISAEVGIQKSHFEGD